MGYTYENDEVINQAIIYASSKGLVEVVKLLINSPLVDSKIIIRCITSITEINISDNDNKLISDGHISTIRLLINNPLIKVESDVNYRENRDNDDDYYNSSDRFLLNRLCILNDIKSVKMLLYNVSIHDNDNYNEYLSHAIRLLSDQELLYELYNNSTVDKNIILYSILKNGFVDKLHQYLQQYKISDFEFDLNDTPLFIACYYNQNECVKLLLEQPDLELNQTSNDGYTPLMYAQKDNNTEIINMLMSDSRILIN